MALVLTHDPCLVWQAGTPVGIGGPAPPAPALSLVPPTQSLPHTLLLGQGQNVQETLAVELKEQA